MKTVNEVSKLTGVSIRALHYYDSIGLLPPSGVSDAGYRLYDDAALERLQSILLFRELEFSLKDIKRILDSPDFSRQKALEQQIGLLELKKEHIENLICLARGIRQMGEEKFMDFKAFDTKKIEEYREQAKAAWGATGAWKEFEQKDACRSDTERFQANAGLMAIFEGFGALRGLAPSDRAVQAKVQELRDYISRNFYSCTLEILQNLGRMYAAGGNMTENIDRAGGEGTARLAAEAVEAYCGGKR